MVTATVGAGTGGAGGGVGGGIFASGGCANLGSGGGAGESWGGPALVQANSPTRTHAWHVRIDSA
jgi:hypothetical protein